MEPKAKVIGNDLYFKNFMVKKEAHNFYGVYEVSLGMKYGELITSSNSMGKASKKARLLQIGYDLCKNEWVI